MSDIAQQLLESTSKIFKTKRKGTKKSGRYWIDTNTVCNFAIVILEDDSIDFHCSGTAKFRIRLIPKKNGIHTLQRYEIKSSYKLTDSNVVEIIEKFSNEVLKSREKRIKQEEKARSQGLNIPGFAEKIGLGYSIKKENSNLPHSERITREQSDKNFKAALMCGYFHQGFVTFCKAHNFYCYHKISEE